jgi:hypothetical protein
MAYFAELKNAPYKRSVELGEGTHFVMLETAGLGLKLSRARREGSPATGCEAGLRSG